MDKRLQWFQKAAHAAIVVGKHSLDKGSQLIVGAAALGKHAEPGLWRKIHQRLKERLHLGEPALSHIPWLRTSTAIRELGEEQRSREAPFALYRAQREVEHGCGLLFAQPSKVAQHH